MWKYLQLPSRGRLPNNATKKGRETGGEERRKLRNLVAFVIGMEGGLKGEGMPPEVFHILMSFLMPSSDPLRGGNVAGPLLRG